MWLNIFILYFVDKKRFKMLTVWHIQTQEKNSVKFEPENPTLWFRLQHQMCQISSHTFLSSTDPLRSSQLKFLLNSVSTTSRTLHNWQYSLSLSLNYMIISVSLVLKKKKKTGFPPYWYPTKIVSDWIKTSFIFDFFSFFFYLYWKNIWNKMLES